MTPTVFLFPGSSDQLKPTGVPIRGKIPRCGILVPLGREELVVAGEAPEKGEQFADDLIKQVGTPTVPFRAVKGTRVNTWREIAVGDVAVIRKGRRYWATARIVHFKESPTLASSVFDPEFDTDFPLFTFFKNVIRELPLNAAEINRRLEITPSGFTHLSDEASAAFIHILRQHNALPGA